MRQVQVEVNQSRPRHGIARHASGAIIQDAVVIVIAAGGDVHRLAGVNRECGAEREEFCRLGRGQQIELVQTVGVGSSPVGRGIEAVRREESDAAGVVVGAAESVLDLAGEIFAGASRGR